MRTIKQKNNLINGWNQIVNDSDYWDQGSFESECGTSRCLFGWIQYQVDGEVNEDDCHERVRCLCGLSQDLAEYLSHKDRTLDELGQGIFGVSYKGPVEMPLM